ncbi:hypothetical protein [Microbacterium rhizosphaerae]|uniref:Uncharacterized protein n=1 Tax=Microbacterium rhizosphaerae TaxID=1678237 RepID=A0ABZ0SSK7_9MICO|nr:hypothetical protein [Microbacterium rhizosphaerae]WPR90798.1 hypothetical protein SM116_05755 [Microbacterium rhizosphaerae]
MTFSVRHVLIGLAVAFTAYLSARGLWWTEPVARPVGMIASLVVYLLITWLCLLVEPAGGRRTTPDDHDVPLTAGSRGPVPLPTWAAALAFALAIALPTGLTLFAGTGSAGAPYVTWYIGGIGALMTIVMVRRRTWWAWAGTAALAVVSAVWLGPLNALAMGLVGSILWVGVAQLLMRSFDRAARDTSQLQELQAAASSWQAAQSGRRRERRVQVQRALTIAGPVLTRAIEVGGAISPADRAEATIAEGRLRDELRGGRLLDDDVREALERARRRGAVVTVYDEGGLDDLSEPALVTIRRELAAAVGSAHSDRLFVRTSPDADVAVTVVGRSAGGPGRGEDETVDLWREIPRRPA